MKSPLKPLLIERITSWTGSIPSLIVHTLIFIGALALGGFGLASFELVLLVLTTLVSLEAIYLAIFIQMTVNRNTVQLREVEEDIDEIQEDVEELGEDLDEIQEDIEEIQEDVEEITEEEKADEARKKNQSRTLEDLTSDMRKIIDELETLKKKQ
ncbi:MAG: hypothetical protein WBK28_02430 [Minisyncoccia bacterium]